MSKVDVANPPRKSPRPNQLTPLLISQRLAIVLQPATPHVTPPSTPIINTALLSPPSLERRSSSESKSAPNPPPPRPASAPPTFNRPSSPTTSDNSLPWYLSRNSLIARRTGRTVTVPPPPLGQSLVVPYSLALCLTHHSSTHYLLAESKQIRGVGPFLLAIISSHPSVLIHRCWPRPGQAIRRHIRLLH